MKRITGVVVFVIVAFAGIGFLIFLQSHRQPEIASIRIPDKYVGLDERVISYFRLEQQKKWDEAWSFRVPLFQQTVPKDIYVRQQTKDNAGWELMSYTVRHVSEDGPCVILEITFVENAPKDHFQRLGSFVITEDSLWERIDGNWRAWNTASRMHLSLNNAIAAPNQSQHGNPTICRDR